MSDFTLLAEGLAFPEGPVVLPDGTLAVVEIGAGRVTHVDAKGRTRTLAETGGGPNGAALGPGGQLFVCNNGGFSWARDDGRWRPVARAAGNDGGRIERIDLATGRVERVYESCDGRALSAPNDIVFDAHGGFWFTDHGHRSGRTVEFGSVYYARADGSAIAEMAFPLLGPNGIGLSPDGTRLYVAETSSGRVWFYRVTAPGCLAPSDWPSPTGGDLLCGLPGFRRYDSLALEACGNVVVAALRLGGLDVVSPGGDLVERIDTDDPYTTNLCFGGAGRMTAFITLSGTGRLVSRAWARPGLALAH